MLREKIFGVDQLDPVAFAEFLGATPDHHHMLRLLHHGARQDNWIADMLDAGDRTRAQGFPIHDAGVHFIGAGAGKDRAFAGIEMRIILQHADCGFDRVETRSARVQNFAAGAESVLDSRTIFPLAFGSHFAALDRAGSTMHRKCDSIGVLFHGWRIFLRRRGQSAKSQSQTTNCQRSQLHDRKETT